MSDGRAGRTPHVWGPWRDTPWRKGETYGTPTRARECIRCGVSDGIASAGSACKGQDEAPAPRCSHEAPRYCARCGSALELAEQLAEARSEIRALQARLRDAEQAHDERRHDKGEDGVSRAEVERVVKGYDGQRARQTIGQRQDVRERIARALLRRMMADAGSERET